MNLLRTRTPRHRGDDPNDLHTLAGQWHIGRSWPGMFPWLEQKCPCPKAQCGLIIPDPAVPCPDHHGGKTIRQAHQASECRPRKRAWRAPKSVLDADIA